MRVGQGWQGGPAGDVWEKGGRDGGGVVPASEGWAAEPGPHEESRPRGRANGGQSWRHAPRARRGRRRRSAA
eukprot:2752797-Prymnesium_polylepis.2